MTINEEFINKLAKKGWHLNKDKQCFELNVFDYVVSEVAIKDIDNLELAEQKMEKAKKEYTNWLAKSDRDKFKQEQEYYIRTRRGFDFKKDQIVLIMTDNGLYSGIIGKVINVKKFDNPDDPTINGKNAYRIQTLDGNSRGYFGGDDLFLLKQLDES